MKKVLSKEEYARLEDEYIKEQLKIANPKPSGMCGTWGWHIVTKKQFARMLKEQGVVVDADDHKS